MPVGTVVLVLAGRLHGLLQISVDKGFAHAHLNSNLWSCATLLFRLSVCDHMCDSDDKFQKPGCPFVSLLPIMDPSYSFTITNNSSSNHSDCLRRPVQTRSTDPCTADAHTSRQTSSKAHVICISSCLHRVLPFLAVVVTSPPALLAMGCSASAM